MLDALKTSRPIIVRSSFGHTVLANSRALALAKITKDTSDPLGGKIWRDADGNPTGLLEDAAFAAYSKLIPQATPEENVAAAKAAQMAWYRREELLCKDRLRDKPFASRAVGSFQQTRS